MRITDKELVAMCGWPVFKEAKAIHAAARVTDATSTDSVLKGRILGGEGKQFFAGLRFNSPIDIDNLCPCRDSRSRGIICAHSVAVGLQFLNPVGPRSTTTERGAERIERASGPSKLSLEAAVSETSEAPRVRLRIEGSLRHVDADVEFHYSAANLRNPAFETAVLSRMIGAGFVEENGRASIRGEAAILRFYAHMLPALRNEWEVIEGDRFQTVTRDLVRIEAKFAIRESTDGWLDLHIHHTAGNEAVLPHADLLRLLQSGKSSITLKSGRVAVIDGEELDEIAEVLRDSNPEQISGRYRIQEMHREYVEATIRGLTGRGEESATPRSLGKSELGPMMTRLRPYQIEGALWMLEKARRKSAGLLADEMGLGKTVQTLAMVEVLAGPVLVVCPASLVWNWRNEAARFLPDLPVTTIEGAGREQKIATLVRPGLAITSYGLLRRDIECYRSLEFEAVILDEAQHIKNPDSQNAKAACGLRTKSRFILTGTPVENSVRDLWSLFEFLCPGYLGHRNDFRERYEVPVLAGDRSSVWSRLNRRIRPWMLRRRKSELLKDLPPKIEQVIEVELTSDQKSVYSDLQRAARNRIEDLAAGGNAGAARMQVFTALLRLRQACCDLRLLGSQKGGPDASAKLSVLLELLAEAGDAGHRVLVFSQFTSMLDLIQTELTGEEIPFVRLDGSTRDREGVVDEFQRSSSRPVFLISLKAGGTGLNLTAADTVIHFDPWWNPAVEAQATDRAHRIGQKSVVTSIKLIARNTVEERVLRLQQRKRELIDGTVDADAAFESLDSSDLAGLIVGDD